MYKQRSQSLICVSSYVKIIAKQQAGITYLSCYQFHKSNHVMVILMWNQ